MSPLLTALSSVAVSAASAGLFFTIPLHLSFRLMLLRPFNRFANFLSSEIMRHLDGSCPYMATPSFRAFSCAGVQD